MLYRYENYKLKSVLFRKVNAKPLTFHIQKGYHIKNEGHKTRNE